ncbi:MAG: TolC family protein [Bacteroidota bacterium]
MKAIQLFFGLLILTAIRGAGAACQVPSRPAAGTDTPAAGVSVKVPETSPRIITLKECLSLSVVNSPSLKIARLDQARLRYNLKATTGAGLPQVRFSGSYDDYLHLPTQMIPNIFSSPPNPSEMIPVQFGTSFNISGALEASQLLYDQSWLVGMTMARQMMQQNDLVTEKTRIEVVFDVAQSYYLAQITRQQLRNMQSNLEKIGKAEKIAASQYENGIIKKIDLDRIAVQKNNMITEIERLQVIYLQNLAMLKYFMGLGQEENIAMVDSVSTAFVTPGNESDLVSHIDIRLIGMQKQLTGTAITMDQALYYPTLSLIGSTGYMNQSNTMYLAGKPTDWFNTSLVGIRLSIPVFSGMQKHYKVAQARIELDKLKVSEADTRALIRINSEDASRKLLNSVEAEKRQRENMLLAERVYNISQEQYQKGMIPLTDLLNTETALSDAQTNHIYALVQMKLSELNYLKSNGKLLNIME